MAKDVKIKFVLNGWRVKVGCQEIVFTSKKKLLKELSRYLDDPKTVEREYLSESVNSDIVNGGNGLIMQYGQPVYVATDGELRMSIGNEQ